MRACALHDFVVSRRVEALAGNIDVIHTWPLGALRTLEVANRLGIVTVLERPNAHTRFAYEAVERECERLRVPLPRRHEHAYQPDVLRKEEAEYRLATRLLCPSEFTLRTFLDQGFPRHQLARHFYGYDEQIYYPNGAVQRNGSSGLRMLFVGVCAVRKGLHYALEAWLRSPASRDGTFQIAGAFLPAYHQRLITMLSHPSVQVLGHRRDIASLMRCSDVLVLPSIEEGFGLVCTEAMGSGCVPLVSEACTDICEHNVNALVHPIGDVSALESHITMLWESRSLLARLRARGLETAPKITWTAAGRRLLDVYRDLISVGKSVTSEAQIECSQLTNERGFRLS